LLTWEVTIISVSSHSFTSVGNLFSTKTPKKFIETSFGLFGITVTQEESISVLQFLPEKSPKQVQTSKVKYSKCFPSLALLFLNQMSFSFLFFNTK